MFLFLALVGTRISWLLIEDEVLAVPRRHVLAWAERHDLRYLSLFVECPWCVGFWGQAALVASLDLWFSWSFPMVALWPFALNMVCAPLHHLVDRLTRD